MQIRVPPRIELATFLALLGALLVRFLKLLLVATLAVVAVTAGFVVVASLTAAVLLFLGIRGLWRRLRGGPRGVATPAAPAGEVIDVTATEVATESKPRELQG